MFYLEQTRLRRVLPEDILDDHQGTDHADDKMLGAGAQLSLRYLLS